ncbi:spermidine synthase [Octopus bimaculoides]|uniref:PABS domain-containing protein n=1 Tax=Octopus bimaculoides TaxID=37653 RepID=A0A0L8HSS7_OCTBM|nr:spermidine synthase [Octopus bimaculoides]|eukprot:XP_014770081.1 PREDICTED: spermidine synthase-like [Octopus bimaculoides]
MSHVENGWFHEIHNYMDLGISLAVEIEEVLFQGKSDYQDIQVFRSKKFGNMLVLDGLIQCTEWDEFAYQEMIANLPLYSHPNPKKVLVIGGGDGGVLREVAKHPMVKQIVLCELDEKVIEVSKQFLPKMALGFSHPKVTVCIEEGTKYMQQTEDRFDIIINDCTDPVGPGLGLYSREFYENIHKVLNPGGILCSQGESQWFDHLLLKDIITFAKELFPRVAYAYAPMPTYLGGQIGFILCSKNQETKFSEPVRFLSDKDLEVFGMKYYNSEIHKSAFCLPQFSKHRLGL